MALPGTAAKIGIIIVLLLALAGWAIAVAGLAKLTDMCRKDQGPWVANNANGNWWIVDNIDKDKLYDCGITFSLDWWIMFIELMVIVLGLLGSFINALNSRHVILYILGVSTTLWCIFANKFIKAGYIVMSDDNDYQRATAAGAAGAIIVLTCNFLFAFMFGPENAAPAADAAQPPISKA
uniref:MARVEL domain-containing protein n=1 Tax=Chlamydomonas leiostraca TaxID=1034604 RepID=A0A7S0WPV4_9CHLO